MILVQVFIHQQLIFITFLSFQFYHYIQKESILTHVFRITFILQHDTKLFKIKIHITVTNKHL